MTCDTSVAHVAGALGRPVWLLVKKVPDWRWLLDREDSPWSPTMRLFRQQQRSDWAGLIEQVADVLRATKAHAPIPAPAHTDIPASFQAPHGRILIPVSIGEIFDKITMLEIKAERLSDPAQVEAIRGELELLQANMRYAQAAPALQSLHRQLKATHAALWDLENAVQECGKRGSYGADFVILAREIFQCNNKRTTLKHDIDTL